MTKTMKQIISALSFFFFLSHSHAQQESAQRFLQQYDTNISYVFAEQAEAMFQKATNITKENSRLQNEAEEKASQEMKLLRRNARSINFTTVNAETRRQFDLIFTTMSSANFSVSSAVTEIGTQMEDIYGTASIPNDVEVVKSLNSSEKLKELTMNAQLDEIMATSRDLDELLYVWKSWRDATGPKLRPLYTEYVRLKNIGARENGFKDAGDFKRKRYEVDNLEKIVDDFMKDLKPLYKELHGYVRYHLAKNYPGIIDGGDGLIPAHVLGNMWGQSWMNIYDMMVPYPDEPTLDVTPKLKKQHTVDSMFKLAEKFFVSIGWPTLPAKFWSHSLFVQPPDRKVECHASAWDMVVEDKKEPDVRVKMCTKRTQDDFVTIHHELGHIYYDLLYWNQSLEYRSGANPGFHEAVGDTIALSVNTPNHLHDIGLLEEVSSSKESEINFLLKVALRRIGFLPFGYIMDKWMWHVYSGKIKEENMNGKWWEYRRIYQGLKSPVNRTEKDFDPASKYHIPGDTPYIRYFFAYILQFMFHKQVCNISGHTGELHRCSIYNSTEAGDALGSMLSLGRSKPWQEALYQFTGSKELSTAPMKEYFAPLLVWLKEHREKQNYSLGWSSEDTDEGTAYSYNSARSLNFSHLDLILNAFLFCLILVITL